MYEKNFKVVYLTIVLNENFDLVFTISFEEVCTFKFTFRKVTVVLRNKCLYYLRQTKVHGIVLMKKLEIRIN